MGTTHISRRLTKSSVGSVDLLGELASYALEADPVDILGTSRPRCSYLVHFSRNHEGIRIPLKSRRGEIPFGTQSCSAVGSRNVIVLPYIYI